METEVFSGKQEFRLVVMEADIPPQGQPVAGLVFPGDDPDFPQVNPSGTVKKNLPPADTLSSSYSGHEIS